MPARAQRACQVLLQRLDGHILALDAGVRGSGLERHGLLRHRSSASWGWRGSAKPRKWRARGAKINVNPPLFWFQRGFLGPGFRQILPRMVVWNLHLEAPHRPTPKSGMRAISAFFFFSACLSLVRSLILTVEHYSVRNGEECVFERVEKDNKLGGSFEVVSGSAGPSSAPCPRGAPCPSAAPGPIAVGGQWPSGPRGPVVQGLSGPVAQGLSGPVAQGLSGPGARRA